MGYIGLNNDTCFLIMCFSLFYGGGYILTSDKENFLILVTTTKMPTKREFVNKFRGFVNM